MPFGGERACAALKDIFSRLGATPARVIIRAAIQTAEKRPLGTAVGMGVLVGCGVFAVASGRRQCRVHARG
jgi:hypothetical protein